MKAQNVFGVLRRLLLVSLLCHLGRGMKGKQEKVTQGMCSGYEDCDECARNDKCMWCEAESEEETKCQRHLVPCPGKTVHHYSHCKDHCDLSPCDSCVKQYYCHWCISDSTCRMRTQDDDCEFGLVKINDYREQCDAANDYPTDKEEARKRWEKHIQQNQSDQQQAYLYNNYAYDSFDNGYPAAWCGIGILLGFVICATCICCRCYCRKKKHNDTALQPAPVTETNDVIQGPVQQRANDFVSPVIPNPFQQKHLQPKIGNTKKDGVRIYLSPVLGSDDERFTDDEIQPKEMPMINRHSEGRSEGKEKLKQ